MSAARPARSLVPRFAAMLLSALVLAVFLAPHPARAAVAVDTFSAGTAAEIGIRVARSTHPTEAPAVVLVSDRQWRDALAVPSLAAAAEAPVLPLPAGALTAALSAELLRLSPERVWVVGAPSSIPTATVASLGALLPSAAIERLEAADAVSLAARVATTAAAFGAGPPPRAYVVGVSSPADALACGALAASESAPVFAVAAGRTGEVIAAIRSVGATAVVVVGEPAAVPASVESSLAAEFGQGQVRRIRGLTRDRLAVALAADAVRRGSASWDAVTLANGGSPTEMLLAATLAATRRGPLLLAETGSLTDATANSIWAARSAVDRVAFVGTPSTLPPRVRTEALFALRAPAFSSVNAMRHIAALTRNGPRVAGSRADRLAAEYAAAQLRSFGYAVRFQTVRLPNGRTTRNVIAERAGRTSQVIVVGAHIDSKWPAPGANDNGSGVATMLELARDVAKAPVAPTVRFVAFGGEESAGRRPTDHHFGSKQYVRSLSRTQRARIQAMVSLDMVGYGSRFTVRNCGWARSSAVSSIRLWSNYIADPVRYERDTSRDGQSDHEAFERVGIPSAWMEWRPDYAWHTRADKYSHIQPNRIRRTGRMMRGWLLKLTPSQVDALR